MHFALQLLAANLTGSDFLNARCVDRRWRDILTPLVKNVMVSPRHWGNQSAARERSKKLASTFEHMETLQVAIDANRMPKNMPASQVVACMEPFHACTGLTGLNVIVRTAIMPNEGYDEEHFQGYISRWTSLATHVADGLKVGRTAFVSGLDVGRHYMHVYTQCWARVCNK